MIEGRYFALARNKNFWPWLTAPFPAALAWCTLTRSRQKYLIFEDT